MKKPASATSDQAPPIASDNLCKQLAETYPAAFARWLFGVRGKVKVDKTELSREPVRADSVIYASEDDETLHAEFQTTAKSQIPLPLRMLDYYVGLKRQNPTREVRQVLVVLTPAKRPVPDRYEDKHTLHSYEVVYLADLDPAELLKEEGLIPLATLCRAASGETLLRTVAEELNRITSPARRREAVNAARIFAGLRYDGGLINHILKESDIMEESVIYQEIIRRGEVRGEARGEQHGVLKEALNIALRLIELRCGKPTAAIRRSVERLTREQLEALCEAALDFQSKMDVTQWLKQNAADVRQHA